MPNIKTPAGPLVDGQAYTLSLRHGDPEGLTPLGNPAGYLREVTGTVVAFQTGQTVYDAEGHPIGREYTTHYRIDSADGQSVGFLPENVAGIA